MLILQDIQYTHPDKNLLFDHLNLVVNKHDKLALIGQNGAGKSTLLNIMSGNLQVTSGLVRADAKPYYIPQLFDAYLSCTIAEALQIDHQLGALKAILEGHVTEDNLARLNDDWTIEERCAEAFRYWRLEGLDLSQNMATLSGGEKTKVFLAGIHIHDPEIVLMDEPSNHLDVSGRDILYNDIATCSRTVVVVSHDRTLLNLLTTTLELDRHGIHAYGGNYDFYAEQKKLENEGLQQDLKHQEKTLRKAKQTERDAMERQQRLDARGKKKQEKAGLPRIALNTFRNSAEKSTARVRDVHQDKIAAIAAELNQLRKALPGMDKMKLDFDHSRLHRGKVLISAEQINFSYRDHLLWKHDLSFSIQSGDRLVIKGLNGSGKTTLVRMLLGALQPAVGTIQKAELKTVCIDQDYSLINPVLSVFGQAQQYNTGVLEEHDIKIRLNRFLFTRADWDKPCSALSGGECLRLVLCCLMIGDQTPDIIILDEPTNNLDIQNMEILTEAINAYQGTLVVISHDQWFLEQVGVEKEIELEKGNMN